MNAYALAVYESALAINPNDGEAYLGAADCYERLHDYQAAIRSNEKALEMMPESDVVIDLEKRLRANLTRLRRLVKK